MSQVMVVNKSFLESVQCAILLLVIYTLKTDAHEWLFLLLCASSSVPPHILQQNQA